MNYKITNLKKNALLLCLLFMVEIVFSQGNPEIKSDLPVILPPSPTVASLMKFEEIAVNNYTGIPNISLPIYSFPTHSKDLTLNVSLNYHPSSIAANEVSSYVGLGWNLMAGGTISRTVKGLPDDLDEPADTGKHGIYSSVNKYYEVLSYYENLSTMNALQKRNFNELLWQVQIDGIRDSEHDLYQFNFLGYSGRFYIEKDFDGAYNIIKLDNDNNLLIEYNHINKTFIIYDDKGLKYVFDVKEITTTGSATQTVAINDQGSSNVHGGYSYNSAFHLSNVYDTNNNMIVNFEYNTIQMVEKSRDVNFTTSRIFPAENLSYNLSMLENFGASQSDVNRIEPHELTSTTTRSTLTKKLLKIDVIDFGKIYFENLSGRQDEALNADAYRLKSIIIKDINNVERRKFDLVQTYSDIIEKRMILSELKESYEGLSKNYVLDYFKPIDYYVGTNIIGRDYWGFFNKRPEFFASTVYQETDPVYCKADVLQKIVYPTGGCAIFDFESNTYSFIGDQPLTNFEENPENYINTDKLLEFLTYPPQQLHQSTKF